MLRDLLDGDLGDLRAEASQTDSWRYRQTLHEVEAMLNRVLAQLPQDVSREP